jgi:aconitate hydratase
MPAVLYWQWARHIDDPNRKNTIITSYNRNFAKRNDGLSSTHAFVGSPELVTALAMAGTLNFNPLKDKLKNDKGEDVLLKEPTGFELPPKGFAVEDAGSRPGSRWKWYTSKSSS